MTLKLNFKFFSEISFNLLKILLSGELYIASMKKLSYKELVNMTHFDINDTVPYKMVEMEYILLGVPSKNDQRGRRRSGHKARFGLYDTLSGNL